MTIFRLCFFLLLIGIKTSIASNSKIPFEIAGKMILLKATVGGETGNFILDTGVSDLLLNSKYFKGKPGSKVFYGINGEIGQLAVSHVTLQIDENQWNNVYAEVIPMQALEDSKGFPIHGLIGTTVFRQYLLLIDFDRLEIELQSYEKNGESTGILIGGLPNEILPFKYKGGTPLVTVYAGEKELKLTIDTGAEINLFADKLLSELGSQLEQMRQRSVGGLGQVVNVTTVGILKGLRMESLFLADMNTAFSSLTHYNIYAGGPEADGILGYEFLSQFRVAFNFKKREIYLWKREPVLLAVEK
ncbi:pepsin/retropepsin-like aspartic protease family protein [Algoriphagus sp. C2-6-M1]|uniref:pepsin/retropepsin-like aspartic protease family protein n=1 Tax=Algoriphagus persicinus TaxID=3108754 RepID=UPI002B38FC2A|nr:pepsin/retropepsin-like aspartic protease family protein [Algoriphagus sp. C2-6-M1]MEB2779761.1 pepsin/retropepsin-like aspartic protease family protein [Algoriphagus sp. C2-6-M1]